MNPELGSNPEIVFGQARQEIKMGEARIAKDEAIIAFIDSLETKEQK